MLYKINLQNFENSAGYVQDIVITYQVFGQALKKAPVVLVNHSLTGNSQVTGENGWWNSVVGEGKSIDTLRYSILAFNIPGNGFGDISEDFLRNYQSFTLQDVARMQLLALEHLRIENLFAIAGGSIGGALAWELSSLSPNLAENLVPIATDYKTTDWVLAHCRVQDQILNNSVTPVQDARMHAMTFYRTPASFSEKFNRAKNGTTVEFEVDKWLFHHGKSLENTFKPASYKFLNHLLTTIDISGGTGRCLEIARKIKAHIHIVTINSDWFFLAEENWEAYVELSLVKKNISIHEIKSIHGHDAFLVEHRQVSKILSSVFNSKNI